MLLHQLFLKQPEEYDTLGDKRKNNKDKEKIYDEDDLPQVKSNDTTKNSRRSDGAPDSPYLVMEAFSEPVTIMWLSIYAAPDSPDCDSFND